jgi:hypothetical protein
MKAASSLPVRIHFNLPSWLNPPEFPLFRGSGRSRPGILIISVMQSHLHYVREGHPRWRDNSKRGK